MIVGESESCSAVIASVNMDYTETKSNMTSDGIDNFGLSSESMESKSPWKLRVNEKNFSLLLFLLSLSIVIGKVYINHSNLIKQNDLLPPMSELPSMLHALNLQSFKKFTALFNSSSEYEKSISDILIPLYDRYGWLTKAMVMGLLTIAFSWFIIYEDSSIPGVNPPFPLQTRISDTRFPMNWKMQMNYLVGILYGILTFIYMCL